MNCYTTVYDFEVVNDNTKIDSSIVLDRLFLDFDAHDEPLENAHRDFMSVGNKLSSLNIMFNAYFSGKGFHIIAHGEQVNDIRCIQQYYTELAKGHPTLDRTGIQTNRLRRVPNTLNLSSGKENNHYYCSPLDFASLEGVSMYDILVMAKQRNPMITTGTERIVFPNVKPIHLADIEIEIPKPIGKLPIIPCLHNAIMVENPSHYARVYLTQWYRDLLTLGERNVSLEQQKEVNTWDMIRMIATARIIMPKAMVRLSAGRLSMSKEAQTLCFLAGANSIFSGEKLLTTPNPRINEDQELFSLLGLKPRPAHKTENHTEMVCN